MRDKHNLCVARPRVLAGVRNCIRTLGWAWGRVRAVPAALTQQCTGIACMLSDRQPTPGANPGARPHTVCVAPMPCRAHAADPRYAPPHRLAPCNRVEPFRSHRPIIHVIMQAPMTSLHSTSRAPHFANTVGLRHRPTILGVPAHCRSGGRQFRPARRRHRSTAGSGALHAVRLARARPGCSDPQPI